MDKIGAIIEMKEFEACIFTVILDSLTLTGALTYIFTKLLFSNSNNIIKLIDRA